MDFELPGETRQFAVELKRWADTRPVFEIDEASDREGWKQLTEFGLFDVEHEGGTVLDTVCGVMAATHAPLPGPVVEGLVAAHVSPEARQALTGGRLVTIATPAPAGRQVVGWGTRADMVVDEATGATLANGPLDAVHNAYDLSLGWYMRAAAVKPRTKAAARRWLISAAASTGLASGAFAMTLRHARDRHVFGAALSSRQAVQMRLAESRMLLHGCELAVHDAAWRADQRPDLAVESAALTWLYVSRSVATVFSHAHQLYGALGFCTETGLFRYSAAARWLALQSPRRDASDLLIARRAKQDGTPVSLVFDGFVPPKPAAGE
jgi:hypothetical protein